MRGPTRSAVKERWQLASKVWSAQLYCPLVAGSRGNKPFYLHINEAKIAFFCQFRSSVFCPPVAHVFILDHKANLFLAFSCTKPV